MLGVCRRNCLFKLVRRRPDWPEASGSAREMLYRYLRAAGLRQGASPGSGRRAPCQRDVTESLVLRQGRGQQRAVGRQALKGDAESLGEDDRQKGTAEQLVGTRDRRLKKQVTRNRPVRIRPLEESAGCSHAFRAVGRA